MSSSDTFVIVGAGMAGGKAAEALREEGFDGKIVLLGAEAHRPYERPPLSKDYVRGESQKDATTDLSTKGLKVTRVVPQTSSSVPAGQAWRKPDIISTRSLS